jgi:hypothetical protein
MIPHLEPESDELSAHECFPSCTFVPFVVSAFCCRYFQQRESRNASLAAVAWKTQLL